MTTSQPPPGQPSPGQFPSTHWSRVVAAGDPDMPEARKALAALCSAYWYPIYAYIRRRGQTPEQAQDSTQDFFAYLLERDLIAKADPGRGRFRSFLRGRLRQSPGQPSRPVERPQARRRPAHALDRRLRRRGPLRSRARPRADPGSDLRPELGPDAARPGPRQAPPGVRGGRRAPRRSRSCEPS